MKLLSAEPTLWPAKQIQTHVSDYVKTRVEHTTFYDTRRPGGLQLSGSEQQRNHEFLEAHAKHAHYEHEL